MGHVGPNHLVGRDGTLLGMHAEPGPIPIFTAMSMASKGYVPLDWAQSDNPN